MPDASPLPTCPGTPNCHRASRRFDRAPDELLGDVERAIRVLIGLTIGRAERVERVGDGRLRAIFRVLRFRDDLDAAVEPDGDGAVLHLRSASRTGHSDLGVNRRRVEALLRALGDG